MENDTPSHKRPQRLWNGAHRAMRGSVLKPGKNIYGEYIYEVQKKEWKNVAFLPLLLKLSYYSMLFPQMLELSFFARLFSSLYHRKEQRKSGIKVNIKSKTS